MAGYFGKIPSRKFFPGVHGDFGILTIYCSWTEHVPVQSLDWVLPPPMDDQAGSGLCFGLNVT